MSFFQHLVSRARLPQGFWGRIASPGYWRLGSPPTFQRRIALVVGNDDYLHYRQLENAVSDAARVAGELRRLRFDVHEHRNLDHRQMRAAVEAFTDSGPFDVAVVYFAGHAFQTQGRNKLLPTDVNLLFSDEADYPLDLQALIHDVQSIGRPEAATLVFLDACRDEPALARDARRGRSIGGLRLPVSVDGADQGLARTELDREADTFIAFATDPGDVAADAVVINGEAQPHSPFTEAVCRFLATPGLELNDFVKEVSNRVRRNTASAGRVQKPWTHHNLQKDFYFWTRYDARPFLLILLASLLAGFLTGWVRYADGSWQSMPRSFTDFDAPAEKWSILVLLNGVWFGAILTAAAYVLQKKPWGIALLIGGVFMLFRAVAGYIVEFKKEIFDKNDICPKSGGDSVDFLTTYQELIQVNGLIILGAFVISLGVFIVHLADNRSPFYRWSVILALMLISVMAGVAFLVSVSILCAGVPAANETRTLPILIGSVVSFGALGLVVGVAYGSWVAPMSLSALEQERRRR